MKFTKIGLRIWITGASILSFLGGWAFFAQTKPVTQTSPSASNLQNQFSQNQPFNPRLRHNDGFQNPQARSPFNAYNQPRFRSGGS